MATAARARVDADWVGQLPLDLYIPPVAFEILLDRFEGPLDFLLYLVKKNSISLANLALAPIADQYLSYVKSVQADNIDLAAEYLVMAALLTDLKSRLLMPKAEAARVEDDPRAELIARLEAYTLIKQGAEFLDSQPVLERDVFAITVPDTLASQIGNGDAMPTYDSQLLANAINLLLAREPAATLVLSQDPISLDETIANIRRVISTTPISFYSILKPQQGRLGIAVAFMAVLELLKHQRIRISPATAPGQVFTISVY